MKDKLPIDEALYEQGYNQAIKDLDRFDWSAFRREAAKDILCAIITREHSGRFGTYADQWAQSAVGIADSLIEKLKEQ